MQKNSLISVPLVHYCGSYWNIKEANGSVVFQLDIENNSGQKVWQEVEFVFGKYMLGILVSYNGIWVVVPIWHWKWPQCIWHSFLQEWNLIYQTPVWTSLNGAWLFYLLWLIIGCAFIEFKMSTDVERVRMDHMFSCIVFKCYGCFVTKPLKRYTC